MQTLGHTMNRPALGNHISKYVKLKFSPRNYTDTNERGHAAHVDALVDYVL